MGTQSENATNKTKELLWFLDTRVKFQFGTL